MSKQLFGLWKPDKDEGKEEFAKRVWAQLTETYPDLLHRDEETKQETNQSDESDSYANRQSIRRLLAHRARLAGGKDSESIKSPD